MAMCRKVSESVGKLSLYFLTVYIFYYSSDTSDTLKIKKITLRNIIKAI